MRVSFVLSKRREEDNTTDGRVCADIRRQLRYRHIRGSGEGGFLRSPMEDERRGKAVCSSLPLRVRHADVSPSAPVRAH